MPSATLRWDIDASREVSFWWKPEMKLENYDQLADENPYLDREIVLRPRRTPINFGGSFWFNGNMMTFEASGSFRQSSDRDVILSQRGEMTVAYLDEVESIAEFKGSLAPAKPFIVSYSGQIDRAVATNGDTQLPMIPLMKLHGAAEMDLRLPAKIYVSSDYTSPRNVDFPGTRQLSSTLLFGAGISSNVFNNLVLSFDIANLLNTSYFLWEGYAAPGITFTAGLKYNIQ